MTSDPHAICSECGHVQSWHDRDATRGMRSGQLASDRRCYREVGGTGCRCEGFRDSGEVAIVAGRPRTGRGVLMSGVLTLLLVVMGLALLYAYRSQAPAVTTVTLSQAISEVNAGQVMKVTITGGRATLELWSGERQQTTLPSPDEVFQRAPTDHNSANPTRPMVIDYQPEKRHALGDRLDPLEPAPGPPDRRLLLLHDAEVAAPLIRVVLIQKRRRCDRSASTKKAPPGALRTGLSCGSAIRTRASLGL